MPTYDYYCATNGQTVEVSHRMNESLTTWGELCTQAGMTCGETPTDAPIERLISSAHIVNSHTLKNPDMPNCGKAGCGGGMCGMMQ